MSCAVSSTGFLSCLLITNTIHTLYLPCHCYYGWVELIMRHQTRGGVMLVGGLSSYVSFLGLGMLNLGCLTAESLEALQFYGWTTKKEI